LWQEQQQHVFCLYPINITTEELRLIMQAFVACDMGCKEKESTVFFTHQGKEKHYWAKKKKG